MMPITRAAAAGGQSPAENTFRRGTTYSQRHAVRSEPGGSRLA
jgi:hypothetical protein